MIGGRVVVVGGGISGLACAASLLDEAARSQVAVDVLVIEAAAEPGGHARTIVNGEWVVEPGPNGFLDGVPDTRALIQQLGLTPRIVEAAPARRRFIVRGSRLCRVPNSLGSLITSDAISWRGKLRLLGEPWARRAPADVDETVFEFAERRIGREAAETLVDTAVSGISAGDSRTLSVRAQLPMLLEWERHGSLARAMFARRKQSKGRARLITFDRGLGTLTSTLAAHLGGRVMTGVPVTGLDGHDGTWRLGLGDGMSATADQVVFATPSYVTSHIVKSLDSELATRLAAIPYAGLATVALAYSGATLPRPPGGHGYLVPRAENLASLGVLWESSIFPGRAPAGGTLLRVFLGGVRRPDILDLDDEALIATARQELSTVMGVTASPVAHWVFRWPSAIAQYTVGHHARVRAIRERLAGHAGLHVCGTAYDGVSFNSGVASGRSVARQLVRAFNA